MNRPPTSTRLTASGIDALILQLNQSLGITVVIVTHDLTTLFTICGRIAILVDSKITVGTLDSCCDPTSPGFANFCTDRAQRVRKRGATTARKHSHGNG